MTAGVLQLGEYLDAAHVNDGVVFLWAPQMLAKRFKEFVLPDKRIIVLVPEAGGPA
jgi:hypothetical protein